MTATSATGNEHAPDIEDATKDGKLKKAMDVRKLMASMIASGATSAKDKDGC